MRCALLFQGSRGDVQPGICLGLELRARGHEVVLAVPPNLVDFARRSGLDVVACGADTAAVLASDLATRGIKSRNPIRRLMAAAAVQSASSRNTREVFAVAAAGSDVIVGSGVGQECAVDVAELLAIPYVPVHFCPVRRNGVASILPLPATGPRVTRAGWSVLDRALWAVSRRADNRARAELGLPPATASVATRLRMSGAVEIQAYDPQLFDGLSDEWGATRPLVGFLRPDASTARALQGSTAHQRDLDTWLDAGTPPVYVGFGSMTVPDALIDTVVESVRRRGRRVLLVGGWHDLGDRWDADAGHDLVVRDSVDHDAVLPRCAAVIHHGGAGSVAAGLRAGRPTLVCHVGADQPLWGARITAAGVGAAVPAARASTESVDRALTHVLAPETAAAAEQLSARLLDPVDAVRRSAELVEHAVASATSPVGVR